MHIEEIDFVTESLREMTPWTDGSTYMWDKWCKNYDKQTFRGMKRRIAEVNRNNKKCKWCGHE